ncbi:hypothetical protein PHLGIDRAFT_468266 [Phlebiopsis gigantea 11061_1 CR5-6]|uniref:Uncharacterized protein n=1 Tax=Phlebiopsis gigantea (strain 11061_1 CR5-6) TaxID=745531 RepID=A0A0C3PJB4_PHLG1|nr:hypothetical protein PHLGIDRAFT_468266 [Phlebiopsis gigantea 11061_1 CR5-6]
MSLAVLWEATIPCLEETSEGPPWQKIDHLCPLLRRKESCATSSRTRRALFDTERSIVSFRLLNGLYPLVSCLTVTGKEKIKDDSEMVDGGATAEQLGMKGVKWNLFFSQAYMVTGNHQREAKCREAVARKAAKFQVPQTLYTERAGCHEGVTFPLDKLHFIGLIPITNGRCAYVCVLGYMEQSEALSTKGPMENGIQVNSEIGQFSGSGAYGAAVASNVPSGDSDSVYLYHPYPDIYDAPAARAAQDSEPVAAVSPINAHMYWDRSIRANALDEGLYQSHQHGCQWNTINDYPVFPTN